MPPSSPCTSSRTTSARKVCQPYHITTLTHLLMTMQGKEVSHAFAKEALAAMAGVEVDRIAEMNGADYVDREKAKHEAKKRSEQLYDQHYGDEENYNPNKKHPHRKLQQEFGN